MVDCGWVASRRVRLHEALVLERLLSGISMTWGALKQKPKDPLGELKFGSGLPIQ